jgi:hypothetical protein
VRVTNIVDFDFMNANRVPLFVQESDPPNPPSGKYYFYSKLVSGVAKPFLKSSDGTVTPLFQTTISETVYQIDDVPAITNADIGKGMVVGTGPIWTLGYASVDLSSKLLAGTGLSWAFANGQAQLSLIQNSPIVAHRDKVDVTASKTLAITDMDKRLSCNSTSAITLTIPPFGTGAGQVAFNHSTELEIIRYGSGAVSYGTGAGVTVVKKSGLGTSITAQYGVMMLALMDLATNTWLASGDI